MLEAWRFRRNQRGLYVAQASPQIDDEISKKSRFRTGTSPHYSSGVVARAAKGGEVLGFSGFGRRRRSCATLRRTNSEKHERSRPFAVRSRLLVNNAGYS